MQEVMLGRFHKAIHALDSIEMQCRTARPKGDADAARWMGQQAQFDAGERDDIAMELGLIATRLAVSGFVTSSRVVNAYIKELQPLKTSDGSVFPRVPPFATEVLARVEEIRRAIIAEGENLIFLNVPNEDAEWYRSPLKDWDEVLLRWPEVRPNIEECSKCFALERHGAAAFHVLLVAEFGVIKFSELLQVQGDRPGWGAVERLHRITLKKPSDRLPLEQANFVLLEKLVPLMLAIRTSWRHKLEHVDNQLKWLDTDFSPKLVKEIISATQGFMRILALDLPFEIRKP